MLNKFQAQFLVKRIGICELYCDLAQILTIESHPCGPIRLLQVSSAGQPCTPVKDSDVVQSQKSAFTDVLPNPVFAIDPPGKIYNQLMKVPREKVAVAPASVPVLQVM